MAVRCLRGERTADEMLRESSPYLQLSYSQLCATKCIHTHTERERFVVVAVTALSIAWQVDIQRETDNDDDGSWCKQAKEGERKEKTAVEQPRDGGRERMGGGRRRRCAENERERKTLKSKGERSLSLSLRMSVLLAQKKSSKVRGRGGAVGRGAEGDEANPKSSSITLVCGGGAATATVGTDTAGFIAPPGRGTADDTDGAAPVEPCGGGAESDDDVPAGCHPHASQWVAAAVDALADVVVDAVVGGTKGRAEPVGAVTEANAEEEDEGSGGAQPAN